MLQRWLDGAEHGFTCSSTATTGRSGPASPVVAAVVALGASASPVGREAAAVLAEYYLRGAGGHDLVAHRLHLSPATYFGRLRHGLLRLAELLG